MTITGTRQFGDAGWSYHPALEAALDMLAGGLRDQMARRVPNAPREVHRDEMLAVTQASGIRSSIGMPLWWVDAQNRTCAMGVASPKMQKIHEFIFGNQVQIDYLDPTRVMAGVNAMTRDRGRSLIEYLSNLRVAVWSAGRWGVLLLAAAVGGALIKMAAAAAAAAVTGGALQDILRVIGS